MENSSVGMIHIGIGMLILQAWAMLMQFSVRGCFTEIDTSSKFASKITRETKGRAFACAILYGVCVPMMLIMATVTSRGVYRSPIDVSLFTLTAATILINLVVIAYMILTKSNRLPKHMKSLSILGYFVPTISIVGAIIYNIKCGGIL